ncbi:hypothetical protein [Rufibacter ruber]|uniref:hypothetical protein n=1 Tax=Rufibacter ruber TaxID=1783499 RepID=UPI00082F2BFC|nr:hypothetical protein [Rufibacter ruber]
MGAKGYGEAIFERPSSATARENGQLRFFLLPFISTKDKFNQALKCKHVLKSYFLFLGCFVKNRLKTGIGNPVKIPVLSACKEMAGG